MRSHSELLDPTHAVSAISALVPVDSERPSGARTRPALRTSPTDHLSRPRTTSARVHVADDARDAEMLRGEHQPAQGARGARREVGRVRTGLSWLTMVLTMLVELWAHIWPFFR